MKKEDNPVPSLNDRIINVLTYWLEENKCPKTEVISLIKQLQNGVETDKEQPKKYRCSCGLRVEDKSKHYH